MVKISLPPILSRGWLCNDNARSLLTTFPGRLPDPSPSNLERLIIHLVADIPETEFMADQGNRPAAGEGIGYELSWPGQSRQPVPEWGDWLLPGVVLLVGPGAGYLVGV